MDQLPSAPSRKAPGGFGARIVSGGLCGAALGVPAGWLIAGGIAGIAGAVIGTVGGYAARAKLAAALRKDTPAAFIEDAVAISAAIMVVMVAR
jgi:uncharacterized membrane protein